VRLAIVYLLLAFVAAGRPAQAAHDLESPLEAATPAEAFTDGSLLFAVRPRYTWVDQGQPDKTYWGSVRTTLGWKTLSYYGFRVTAEAINVSRFDEHNVLDYRDTPAYRPRGVPGALYAPYGPGYYPRVADPETTDANRLLLEYNGFPETQIRLGRQTVRIDNQRFIGDYDAAQLPQALDGVMADNQSLPYTRVSGGYFNRVRDSYAVERQARIGVLNARFEPDVRIKLAAYGYAQNQAQTGSVTGLSDNSNRIVGGRIWGAWPLAGRTELVYSAEGAQQRAFADGDPRIDAPYRRVGAGVAGRAGFARVDWERLGSNGGLYAFQTPLGTTQLFTGRADVFATTPIVGLRDLRGSLGANFYTANLRLDYHRFHSDSNDRDLGREWDLTFGWSITSSISVDLGYADYRAGDAITGFPDTRKIWVSAQYLYR